MSRENEAPNTARLTANGPLLLKGRLRRPGEAAADGTVSEVALCRCGGSGNKPYCDGTHRSNGFADGGGCARPPEAVAHAVEGEVAINPIPNGPLRLDGWFELVTAGGERFTCGDKTWLCRCGHSANKPFCDGTHKKIGFTA
jgi:CDGSH-type Zn-finger protein